MKKLLLFIFALFLWTGAWADSKTVYLRPSSSWAAESAVFDVYVFNNTTNGWISMGNTETIDGVTCYKAEVEDTWEGIIFVRKNPNAVTRASWDAKWGDNGAQTPDINLNGVANNTLFTISDTWGGAGDGKTGYTTATCGTYTARFVTNASWSNVYAYAWSGEVGSEIKSLGNWPGGLMSDTDATYGTTSNPIYSVTFTTTAIPEKIIFNDGTTGAVGTNQTADLVFGDNELYVVPIALPSEPLIDENRVITVTGNYGEKDGAYGTEGMSKNIVVSGRSVYHAATPSANSRIEGVGQTKLPNNFMNTIHLAVWTKESVEDARIEVYSDGWRHATTDLVGGTWNDIDIPFSSFDVALVNASAIKVTNKTGAALGSEVYITDVFFYNDGAKTALVADVSSKDGTSVTFKLKSQNSLSATGSAITYNFSWDNEGSDVVNKENGDEFTHTINGLTTGTAYHFSITATDDASSVSDAFEVTVTPIVPTDVPTPTHDSSNVFAVYSQKYGDAPGMANAGNWTLTNVQINEKKTKKASKHVWGQFAFTVADVSSYEKVRLDVFPTENMSTIGIRVQGPGIDSHYRKDLTFGTWNEIEIDLENDLGLTKTQLETINNIIIVKDINGSGGNIDGDGTGEFYVGNIYFWKAPTSITLTAIPGSTTLAKGGTTNIVTTVLDKESQDVTASSTITYESSNTSVLTVENDGTVTAVGVGTANVIVAATYLEEYKEKIIHFTVEMVADSDPTDDDDKVMSIYSDHYTSSSTASPSTVGKYNGAGWSTIANETLSTGNNIYHATTSTGFGFGVAQSISDYNTINVSIYPTSDVSGHILMEGVDGGNKTINYSLAGERWNHIKLDISSITGTNSYTYFILDDAVEDLYIDNFYFSKTSIDPSLISGITIVNKSTSVAEGNTMYLTVKDQLGNNVSASYLTYGSDDTDVATVSAEGIVTAINPGTAIITATVEGNAEVFNTVEITVTEAELGFDLTVNNHTIHIIPYHYYGTNDYKFVITSTEEMEGLGGSYWNINGVGGTDMRTNSGTQTFNVSQDKHTITITNTSTSAPTIYTPLYVLMPGEVAFVDGIQNVNLNWIDVQKVTIGPAEWASFSSTNALDFGKVAEVKAYYATANNGLNISYNTVEKAPAGTGLILGGEQGNYDVPVINAAPALSSTNLLQSTAAGAYTILAEDENKVYVFGKIGSDIGFVKGVAGYVIGANKSYLRLTEALAAKGFNFIGLPGCETDGINKVNTLVETGVRYNLAGQRVGNDYKGIVIVNGRKVVIK